jgi:hypothetical protein
VAALVCGGTQQALAQPGPWEQLRDDDGIVVHRRKHPGYSLHEFRGRGVIEAPIARILGVIQDIVNHPAWVDRCIAAKHLAYVEKTAQLPGIDQRLDDRIVYNRTEGSWPVKDRDVVVTSHADFDVKGHEVRLTFRATTHPMMPPQDGAVRITFLRGHWTLRPTAGGKHTWIEYQVHADPGGSLPTWIVNMATKTLPYKTLMNLRKQAARRRYPDIEKAFEGNPGYRELVGS